MGLAYVPSPRSPHAGCTCAWHGTSIMAKSNDVTDCFISLSFRFAIVCKALRRPPSAISRWAPWAFVPGPSASRPSLCLFSVRAVACPKDITLHVHTYFPRIPFLAMPNWLIAAFGWPCGHGGSPRGYKNIRKRTILNAPWWGYGLILRQKQYSHEIYNVIAVGPGRGAGPAFGSQGAGAGGQGDCAQLGHKCRTK